MFWAAGILLNALGLDFNLARILTTYLMELPNSRMQELEGEPSCTRVDGCPEELNPPHNPRSG